ncbi:MAG: tetratricopeptide repeat protein [Saprospiraceae bacterium]|nr:tetratricopeptide repeat protein [Saprospiraceae bacterium]
MSGKKNKKSSKLSKKNKPVSIQKGGFFSTKNISLLLFFFGCLLYANTIGHDYAQDDAIVIYDNMFTQKGISGIPGILGHDTFYGFFKEEGKANLVSGGRYRPFTPMMFAVEISLFGANPWIGHFINMLVYGMLGVLVYRCLLLLNPKNKKSTAFAAVAALLYIAHPLHTEVVANIKGRDEIMAMLGSVYALYATIKWHDSQDKKWLFKGLIAFFIALMSKENAITFLAVIPLALVYFRSQNFMSSIGKTLPLLGVSVLFIAIRTSILGMDFGGSPNELMNNPFLKWNNGTWVDFTFGERMSTIAFTLGKYLELLIFPYKLSHDYYPRAIEIMSFSDWRVMLSVLLYIAIIGAAWMSRKKSKLISFGLFYYLITLSIVSNIIFPIGTNMSERFLFMPSLGFAIVISALFNQYFSKRNTLIGVTALVVLLYSIRTVTRNTVWKDDYTLFTSDVSSSTRSAKLLNAAGGALSNAAAPLQDGNEKSRMLNEAVDHLKKAITIHPTYRNAYLILGNSYFYQKRYNEAIASYEQCLKISPGYQEVMKNYPIVLREAGKNAGQNERDYTKALNLLNKAYQMKPDDFETCRLLGITYGIRGQHLKAIEFFEKALQLNPSAAVVYASLGTAYLNLGDKDNANINFNKAKQLDPNALNHLKK